MADPPRRPANSNSFSPLDREDDSDEDDFERKNGTQGDGMEVEQENVVMAESTGDGDDPDGNLTEADVQDHLDGKVTLRDRSIGQEFVVNEPRTRAANKQGPNATSLVDPTGGANDRTTSKTAAGKTKRPSYSKKEIAKDKASKTTRMTNEEVQRENLRVAAVNKARLEKVAADARSKMTQPPSHASTKEATADGGAGLLCTWAQSKDKEGSCVTTQDGLEPPSTEASNESGNQANGTTTTRNGTTNGNDTTQTDSVPSTGGNDERQIEETQPERATNQHNPRRMEHNVRYEFFERRNEAPRDTLEELKGLMRALRSADHNASIGSVFIQNKEIRQPAEFPATIQELDVFFERSVVQTYSGQKHALGFTIWSEFTLQELKELHDRDLQHYLQDQRTVLKMHAFDSLTIEQIGWFACKITGIYSERFADELEEALAATVEAMNETEGYQGEKHIGAVPKFEISRSKVFESPGDSRSAQAVDIRCETVNSETLKNILVSANLDFAKFGTFMLFSDRLTSPDMHWNMFNKHAAFLHDVVVIAVEGLHPTVLDEMVDALDG
jgi:hypothetical protein